MSTISSNPVAGVQLPLYSRDKLPSWATVRHDGTLLDNRWGSAVVVSSSFSTMRSEAQAAMLDALDKIDSTSHPDQLFAEIHKDGKVVARIYNGGIVSTDDPTMAGIMGNMFGTGDR